MKRKELTVHICADFKFQKRNPFGLLVYIIISQRFKGLSYVTIHGDSPVVQPIYNNI